MPGSQVADIYGAEIVYERHRHRYEFNYKYRNRLEAAGLLCSAARPTAPSSSSSSCPATPSGWPQAHPEFKSRPDRPHPLFRELLGRQSIVRGPRGPA